MDEPVDATSMCVDTEHDAAPAEASHAAVGVSYALLAYGWWGFAVPLFFWSLGEVGPWELLAVRVATGFPVAIALVRVRGRWREFREAVSSWATMRTMLMTTALISVNWFGFIYVITTERLVLQASLGYYITPLLSVALGMIVLGERLRPMQWAALLLAVLGVVVLAWGGEPPTWALALAFSFAFYGLLRKRANVGPMVGIAIEMGNLFAPALAFGAVLAVRGELTAVGLPAWRIGLLACAGVVTVLPLLWFNHGARRLRLSTLGFIQFLAPTGQFVLAVALMGAPFAGARVWTFGLIWVSIVVFLADSVRHHRRERRGGSTGN